MEEVFENHGLIQCMELVPRATESEINEKIMAAFPVLQQAMQEHRKTYKPPPMSINNNQIHVRAESTLVKIRNINLSLELQH